MFDFVQSVVLNTFQALNFAGKDGMFPLPAVFVLEDFRIYICTMYYSNVTFNIEAMIDEGLGRYTTLEISYIDLYNSYIRFW